MPFTPISEVLEKVIKKYKPDTDLEAYRVFSMWNDIVGPKIGEHTKPLKIKEKILYVIVDDPLWLAQIKYIKQDVLKKLCDNIKNNVFKDIKFFLK